MHLLLLGPGCGHWSSSWLAATNYHHYLLSGVESGKERARVEEQAASREPKQEEEKATGAHAHPRDAPARPAKGHPRTKQERERKTRKELPPLLVSSRPSPEKRRQVPGTERVVATLGQVPNSHFQQSMTLNNEHDDGCWTWLMLPDSSVY